MYTLQGGFLYNHFKKQQIGKVAKNIIICHKRFFYIFVPLSTSWGEISFDLNIGHTSWLVYKIQFKLF